MAENEKESKDKMEKTLRENSLNEDEDDGKETPIAAALHTPGKVSEDQAHQPAAENSLTTSCPNTAVPAVDSVALAPSVEQHREAGPKGRSTRKMLSAAPGSGHANASLMTPLMAPGATGSYGAASSTERSSPHGYAHPREKNELSTIRIKRMH